MSIDNGAKQRVSNAIAKLPLFAAVVALVGLADSVYLTIHHYNAAPVPCGAAFDCEMVLTSPYAMVGGIPLAAFGAAAYFIAFSLALLAAYGYHRTWTIFGIQTVLMAAFTCWLIYVQAVLIHAFCQFCLISAATTATLLILFLASVVFGRRQARTSV